MEINRSHSEATSRGFLHGFYTSTGLGSKLGGITNVILVGENGRVAMVNYGDVAWAVVLAVMGWCIWTGWMAYRRNRGVGITRWPLVGMLPGLLVNVHHFYEWITHILVVRGGSYQFYGPKFTSLNYFVTADPRNLEYVLRDNFSSFPKGPDFINIFHDLLGHGIFNADDDMWRIQRKAASLQLNTGAHRRFADATIFSAAHDKLVSVMQRISTHGGHVDLQQLLLRFTFDTVCKVGFGVGSGCLTADLPTVPFAKAFEHALDCTTVRFYLPDTWWKVIRWLKIGKERGMPAAMAVVDSFVTDVVDARRKELAADKCATERSDLLSCFMKLETANYLTDDTFLKDVCINFLLAGRDTSALALSWFFWLIASHPDKEAKLLEEIEHTLAASNGVLSREMLNRMSYLHASLSESLRLYPSVPIDIKHILQDDVLPDGHRVYKDHKLIYSMYTMGRMESIWGPDCRKFRPERWLDAANAGQVIHVSPFQFPAFNAGPRTCLGKDMAFLLMKSVACTLLHNFRIVLVPGHVVEPKLSITLYMKRGLLVSLEPRRFEVSC